MKKIALLMLAIVCVLPIAAQEENTDRYPSSAGFVTNRFFDNWEISLGAGAQFFTITGANNLKFNNYGAFKDRISAELELSVGKWITPIWGMKAQVQGAWLYGFPNEVDYTSNVKVKGISYFTSDRFPGQFGNSTTMGSGKDSRDILRHRLYYTTVQIQAMCDLTAWIGGYRPERIYNAILFGGIGWIGTLSKDNDYPKNDDFAGSFGLSNRFRTCKFLDVYIDLKSLAVKNTWYNPIPGKTGVRTTLIPSISAGLTFRLPQQDFKRVPHCDYQPFYNEIDLLNDALAAEKSQKEKLASDLKNTQDSLNNTKNDLNNTKVQLDSCQNNLKKKPKVIEKIIIQKPTEDEQKELKDAFDNIYFKTGKAVLDVQSYAPLERSAKILKKYPKVEIRIMGHTDNVGKPASNLKLSQQRANAVRLFLIKKGVKAENITAIGYGDTKPVADNATAEGRELNRRTEIEIK